MKKLTGWLKKQFANEENDWAQMTSSIQKMAARNGINRRRNARIFYPNSNYSAKLPQIIFNNSPVKPVDISLGGVCLLNDKNQFGTQTGETVPLILRWLNEADEPLEAKIVGQSYQKVHLQFEQLPTELYVKLSLNLKSGMVGRKFQQAFLNENQNIQPTYQELWIGINNEKLVFPSDESFYAELSYFGINVKFFKDKKPWIINSNGKEMKFKSVHLADCIILLANIPTPSRKIKELISILENFEYYFRSAG